MIKKSYEFDTIKGDWSKVEKSIKDLIESKMGYVVEDMEDSNCQVIHVNTPFILADNGFDLREANNTLEEVNAEITEQVSFTGGGFYNIYKVKDVSKPSIIVHGNIEEGFNIFILN